MYRLLVASAFLASFHFYKACGQTTGTASSNDFHWLDPAKEAANFAQIKAAFVDELKPDDPEKVKPVVRRSAVVQEN
jgi:hypothetical protein